MLTPEQYDIINSELSKDNSVEFVKVLLDSFSNNIKNINILLEYIPKLANKILEIKDNDINKYSWAVNMLIADRNLHPHKYKKDEENSRFCVLLYTCNSHFKHGKIEGHSKASALLFNEFIDMLKEKDVFDYTDESEWGWVKNSACCDEWLESVIQQNIDSTFTKPNI